MYICIYVPSTLVRTETTFKAEFTLRPTVCYLPPIPFTPYPPSRSKIMMPWFSGDKFEQQALAPSIQLFRPLSR